jgi:HAE1 family hydrophobic/amphiphilic exporter-1
MTFSRFFIHRPIFATVLALLFIVAGLVALHQLPVAQYPDITPPTVQVSASYPGANAETIAQTIGIPIEQQVNGVEGMLYMKSSSSASGGYSLTITFAVGTDIDMATVMVQNRVNVAVNSLPEVVKVNGVTVKKQSSNIVMMLSLTGDSIYDGLYLTNYANLNLVDPLTRVEGVGNVDVMGAGAYSMRVWMRPEVMRMRDLTPADIYSAIQDQNLEVSAGYVGQPIGTRADNAFQYTLQVKGRLATPEEFGNIVVKTGDDGRILRLRDVADIELGSASYAVVSTLAGQPTAGIAIYQLPGSNATDVAERVREEMAVLAESFPPGVHYGVTLDTTDVVRSSIHEVLRTLLEALILVVAVIFFFLQNARAVLIPCLTIPVSLIGTLAVMAVLGYSINTLTLFGLVLAIAIVVDDSIVVTENATRLLDEGERTPRQAVTEAMREIEGPVIGVVLVLLAVFLPTALISGISGQLYRQFALTIAASTVISGLNSLTLTPALCAVLLRKTPATKPRLFRAFDAAYGVVQRGYERSVAVILRHPVKAGVGYLAMCILAVVWYLKWPTTFIPDEDDGYFLVTVQLPPAASLERTQAVGLKIDELLKSYPEVKTFLGVSGLGLAEGGQSTNAATYFVILRDWDERRGKAHSAQAVATRFNEEAYALIQEAQVYALVPPAIPGLGNTGGLQMELEDRRSLGSQELQKAVDALLASYTEEPSLASARSQYQANVPQYFLRIDRDRVEMMGLTMSEVFTTLSYFMGQAYVNDFVEFGRIYQVKLEANGPSQRLIDDVGRLSAVNASGETVPFSAFLTVERVLGMDQVSRYNMYRSASVTFTPAEGSSSGQAIAQCGSLVRNRLGDSFGYEWTGVAYQELAAQASTTAILLMALLVVYLVLAAQYESWRLPVAAVMGIPIALLGAMVGCGVMGQPVSIYTQVGIVLLVALSAKNGILIVEFARDFRKSGESVRRAAYEAGRVRLRPILMTSFTFVLGVVPLLFATGAGAHARIALGAAVVFGMFVNTVVATLFIPNGYELVERKG